MSTLTPGDELAALYPVLAGLPDAARRRDRKSVV